MKITDKYFYCARVTNMTDKEFERVLAFLIDRNIVRRLLRSDDYEKKLSESISGRDQIHVQKINSVNLLN
jgi:uncharacterized protein YceH (UPF0502 family)